MHGVIHSIHCKTVETSIQVLISPCQGMPALGWTTKQIISTTGKHFVRPRHVKILPFAGCHVPPKLMNFTLFPQPLQILTQDLVYQADSGSSVIRVSILQRLVILLRLIWKEVQETQKATRTASKLCLELVIFLDTQNTQYVTYSTSCTRALVKKLSTSTTGTCMLTVVR